MADTQTQDTGSQSPDIASLVGGGDKGLLSGFQRLYEDKEAEDRIITGAADFRTSQDQAAAHAAFKAEGVSAAELPKPWNAEEEHKKFEHNPIEGFGSVGGLFAMVASAFTKAPMENAINGMAGAINSIKAGDEAAYERAHQAWQENTKLALERFKTQHELYSDAMSLMDHDMSAANAKLHNSAVRFGDSQMLMLAEHGMVKEMFELQSARAKAAEDMQKYQDIVDRDPLRATQRAAVEAIKKNPPQTGDPVNDKITLAAQIQRVFDGGGKYGTAEQEAVGAFMQDAIRKNKNPQQIADGLSEIHQKFASRAGDPKVQAYNDQVQAWQDAHPGEKMPEDVQHQILERTGNLGRAGAAGTSTSSQALKFRAIQEIMEKHKADGAPISWAEAEHEYNLTKSVPSGNRIDDLQGKVDQAERVIEGSNKNLEFLRTYKGGAGLMGKIMRGEEIAENISGISTSTDRVAFRRRVNELKEMVPRLITDANGRPLKAEQDAAYDVIAGLQAGDTSLNTIRAYEDLIKDMQGRIQKWRERQSKTTPTSSTPTPTGNTDWLSTYPEKR